MQAISNMKKILYVEDGIGFGGSLISLAELINGFDPSMDIDPYVLTYQRADILGDLFPHSTNLQINRWISYRTKVKLEGFLENGKIRRLIKPLVIKGYVLLDVIYQFYLSLIVYRILRKHGIELVHCNNGFQVEAVRAAAWTGIPVIMHIRGLPDKSIGKKITHHKDWVDKVIKRVIGITEHVSKYMIECGMPEGKLITIFDPLDADIYVNAKSKRQGIRDNYDLADDEIVVALFGRITRWKGTLEFLQALEISLQQCPKLKAMVVGDASDSEDPEYTAEIESLAESPILKGRVILTGFQTNVQDFYQAVDIVAHTSIEPEPLGRVVTEGMACEKAVIAMDEGGPPELVIDEYDGILVEPRNIEKLAEAFTRVYQDADLRKKLGENGLKSVRKRFDHHEIAKQVVALYQD